MTSRLSASLLLLASLACSRAEPRARESSSSSPASSSHAQPGGRSPGPLRDRSGASSTGEPLSPELSRPERDLIAIGDLHGDLEATRRALRLAGAIDESDRWIGGTLTVVQTGDILDRGDQDREVLELLERLRSEARAQGGELIVLNGNHEVMNVAADFRYVTAASNAAFQPEGGRTAAFAPGGPFARLLAEHPLVMKVGSSLFVHGGVLAKHVAYGLSRMDAEVRAWMRGELPLPPEIVVSADGLIWSRVYGHAPEACEELERVLKTLGATRMIVGHTVQPQGISSACDGRVWRIDVGLSAFYRGPTEVLEIRGDQPRVRRAAP